MLLLFIYFFSHLKEKETKILKINFRPANGCSSYSSLVEIHNTLPKSKKTVNPLSSRKNRAWNNNCKGGVVTLSGVNFIKEICAKFECKSLPFHHVSCCSLTVKCARCCNCLHSCTFVKL